MNKNYLLLGGALLVAGGAYIAFKKGAFKKKDVPVQKTLEQIAQEQKEREAADAIIAAEKAQRASASSKSNPNSVTSKVAVIQGKLGVAIDGIAGAQTLKALQKRYPYIKAITNDVVDYYYSYIKTYGILPKENESNSVMEATQKAYTGITNPLDLLKY